MPILTKMPTEEGWGLKYEILPPELWAEIFMEVTLPDKESPSLASPMPDGWRHCSRAMLLASVCREWRYLALCLKSLWTTINVAPARQPTSVISSLVDLHLTRMNPVPCSMVIWVDELLWNQPLDTALSPILARVERLHQLRFYLHKRAKNRVVLFYLMVSTPSILILEAMDPNEHLDIYLSLRESAPKELRLISCGLVVLTLAALTHVEVRRKMLNYCDITKWRAGALGTLEHAILRYTCSAFDRGEGHVIAPRLRYLETNTSLLTNRILPLFGMPNLQELVITDTEGDVGRPWEEVASQLGRETRLTKLVVDSGVGSGVHKLVGSLTSLLNITTLELRGNSVEDGLVKLKELISSHPSLVWNLKTVVLRDYAGSGEAILGINEAIQIVTINCPNLSKEVREVLIVQRQGL